jgi:hypothetical protein
MSDINWDLAPEGYDYFIVYPGGLGFFKVDDDFQYYIDEKRWQLDIGSKNIDVTIRPNKTSQLETIEMVMPKQDRYKDNSGDDWIDEFARTATPEEFRGAMKFTIGKYNRRCGKKDDIKKEVYKIADYGQRWLAYEEGLDK